LAPPPAAAAAAAKGVAGVRAMAVAKE